MSAHPPQAGLRLEVQALRAIAALMVVFYHLWPGRMPGGYTGVDVFFVISGFLITAHILREVEDTGRIRLGRFWARRARRLLPAAYTVLAFSAAATYLWIPQLYWVQTFREIGASALYFQNWLLAGDSVNYLAAESPPTVAQHYWTLSVEEQFYLVWPLLILLIVAVASRLRVNRRTALLIGLGVVTVLSALYSLWLTQSNPPAAYFVTPVRVWQFGAGALLALATERNLARSRSLPRCQTGRAVLSWLGLAALATSALAFSGTTPFPGTAAFLPVAGTLAVIVAGAPSSRLSPLPLLRLRPVQVLGDVSYSLYLWHWAPIIVVPYVLGHGMGFWPRLAILIGAIAAAWLTKRYVEDPIRHGKRFGIRGNGVTFGLSAVGAASLVAVCFVGWNTAVQASDRQLEVANKLSEANPPCFGAASMDPAEKCSNPKLDDVLVPDPEAVAREVVPLEDCWSVHDESQLESCTVGDAKDAAIPRVALIGDSHARAMLPALTGLAEQGRIVVDTYLKGGCNWSTRPLSGDNEQLARSCLKWRQNLTELLAGADYDFAVTTSKASDQTGPKSKRPNDFAEAWAVLADREIAVVAIRDNPQNPKDTNDCLSQVERAEANSCSTTRAEALKHYDAQPDAVSLTPHAKLVDFTDFYCTDKICPVVIGGVNVYRDKHHLTSTYTTTLAPYLYRELVAMELLKP